MIKARMKFNKSGSMKFIGHLDVMRYFQKAIRRSEIDVCYSQGFNPHQQLSFASPLGVGLTSDGEYMDIQLNSITSSEDIKNRLNETMTDEMQILNVKVLPEDSKTSMALLAAADYKVSVKDGYEVCEEFPKKLLAFLEKDSLMIVKKTKKSEQEIDLKPFIYAAADNQADFEAKIGRTLPETVADIYENGQEIFLQLTCGSVNNMKPELILNAFCEAEGIAFNEFAYQIHRIEIYTDVNAKKGEVNLNESKTPRKLVPLDEFGELV